MIKKTWALVTILGLSFGCNTRTENTGDAVDEVADITTIPIDTKAEVSIPDPLKIRQIIL